MDEELKFLKDFRDALDFVLSRMDHCPSGDTTQGKLPSSTTNKDGGEESPPSSPPHGEDVELATDPQKDLMKKLHLHFTDKTTKDEAIDIIDRKFKEMNKGK